MLELWVKSGYYTDIPSGTGWFPNSQRVKARRERLFASRCERDRAVIRSESHLVDGLFSIRRVLW